MLEHCINSSVSAVVLHWLLIAAVGVAFGCAIGALLVALVRSVQRA